MPELPSGGVAQGGRLLRVLQLRHGEMSADSGGERLLRLSYFYRGGESHDPSLSAISRLSPLLRGISFLQKRPFYLGLVR